MSVGSRTAWRSVAAVTIAAVGVAGSAVPASAGQRCQWNPDIARLECSNTAPGADDSPGGASGGAGGGGGLLGFWILWRNDVLPEPDACPIVPATGVAPPRQYLQFIPIGNPTGTITATNWCPPAEVPIPPPPPTAAELRALADAPAPAINLAPASRGVTGVPTRLWGGSEAPFDVGPLSLRAWTVTGTATPTRWQWNPGTGDELSSARAGTSDTPAATFTYETKGTYTVETSITYDGSFVVVGPYGVTIAASIGAISISSSESYDVIEVRAARE